MRPLSATECINPAIERTKLLLFTPFRLGRTWKLCATSYVCMMGTFFFPFPLIYLAFVPMAYNSAGKAAAVAVATGVLVLTAVFVWIFFLCSRLQFAWLDMLLNRGEFVAPAWRKYGAAARPWTTLKLALGIAVTAVTAVPATAFVRQLIPLFQQMTVPQQPGQPPSPEVMKAIFTLYGAYAVLMLFFGLLFLVFSLLGNFIVPSLALENTGIKEAFRRLGDLIRREPGEFALFVLLKAVLGLAGYIGATIAWEIAFLLATLIVGVVVFVCGFLLHLAGVSSAILTVLGVIIGIAWYGFTLLYSMLLPIGAVFTWLDAYAAYFLAGRYPLMGSLLDASTPPRPAPALNPYLASNPAYPPAPGNPL